MSFYQLMCKRKSSVTVFKLLIPKLEMQVVLTNLLLKVCSENSKVRTKSGPSVPLFAPFPWKYNNIYRERIYKSSLHRNTKDLVEHDRNMTDSGGNVKKSFYNIKHNSASSFPCIKLQ